ncbi:DUF6155 family protein [Bacillus cereus group sp. BfR-BA-01380]|uniref:DUF6155 family protein n=1 Tax=Bacillus cereus group sp. BfR-BA-01380 TaxID=2920324 RepID=UPI001F585ED3|nr:DUF6155 family protein [Bacillus cereus group sp. BfR-BA-01380]
MQKIKIPTLKKELKEYNQTELITLVVDLFKMNKEVQQYLSSKFLGDEVNEELHKQLRKKIENEFFPERSLPKLRLADLEKMILSFQKTTEDPIRTIDLMLYYVEMGVDFTRSYGDIGTKFYNKILSMFAKLVDLCEEDETYYTPYAERLSDLLSNSMEIAWGFPEELSELYYCIPWLEEEEE